MANSTLAAIRTKIRRLTRSPSPNQISDADIDEYVNTYILYDLPSELRFFNLRTVFEFYTQPNIDTYATDTSDVNDPLFNFKNKFIAVHPPIFMAGVPGFYTQQRDVFYGYWPQTNTIAQTGLVGDGTTGPFVGTLTAHPVLQNSVVFSCPNDISTASMVIVDQPLNQPDPTGSTQFGILGLRNAVDGTFTPLGSINYVTGQYSFSFPGNTLMAAPIVATTISYQPGKPVSMLYYDDKFTLRPVPDQVYVIQIEVDMRPSELLDSAQIPELEQWWQFIAYGASIKIFQDRMDLDSVQLILPEFDKQQRLALRTTLTTYTNQRTVTIYTSGKTLNNYGWFGGSWPY